MQDDFEWASKQLARMTQKTIVNDYFEGATLYRVFYFDANGIERFKDVYATDATEAKEEFENAVADAEIDQIIQSPQH